MAMFAPDDLLRALSLLGFITLPSSYTKHNDRADGDLYFNRELI